VNEVLVYVGRIREFDREDWLVYTIWIGLMCGLLASVTGFVFFGATHGVVYPSYVWNVPIGTFIFVGAIAIDTIGHRTIYKEAIKRAEALVHHVTIFAGITSVLGLCLAYEHPLFMRAPTLVLIFLSIIYSLIDEGMHWHRYFTSNSDRVEMWSHFFILTGHLLMILSWWNWYAEGYPGVSETLKALAQSHG
jgi:hypothetical protein